MGSSIYRDLIKLLRAHGCTFERQAKGSHEVWFSPITNRNIIVPRSIFKKNTAKGILKDAGIKEKI